MDENPDNDVYQVFLLEHRKKDGAPDVVEHPLVSCETYSEARRIQQQALRADKRCVIRYIGPVGGGD
jgi:hypothetical protein